MSVPWKLCLGPGCGRDDWTGVGEGREGGRKGSEWKSFATNDLTLTHLMVLTELILTHCAE